MTATVRGGIVTGIVTDDHFRPVAGAEITVSGGVNLATVSASDGSYSVEGVAGPGVTVQATDPQTHLYGFTTGQMNRSLGHARDQRRHDDGRVDHRHGLRERRRHTAGAGVRVDIYQSTDMQLASGDGRSRTSDGSYGFPFVQLGEYVLDATRPQRRAGARDDPARDQRRAGHGPAQLPRPGQRRRHGARRLRRAGQRRRRHVPCVERGRLGAGGSWSLPTAAARSGSMASCSASSRHRARSGDRSGRLGRRG